MTNIQKGVPPQGVRPKAGREHNMSTTSKNGAQTPQRKPWNRCATTARQIRRDFQESYGTELPNDDAGRDDAALMLSYLAHAPSGSTRARYFLDLWCPWMGQDERELFLQDAVLSPPPRLTADQLAERLGTTYARRQRLRHTLIGAVDADKAERARRRRERERERSRRQKERQRREAGTPDQAAVPRRGSFEAGAVAARRRVPAHLVSPAGQRQGGTAGRGTGWDRSYLRRRCGNNLCHTARGESRSRQEQRIPSPAAVPSKGSREKKAGRKGNVPSPASSTSKRCRWG